MSLLYVIENQIDVDSLCCVSSEDTTYLMENLYNQRPSYPFRFTGSGSAGSPEWICIDFPESGGRNITFAAVFNHNLTDLSGGNDELALKGCVDDCMSSGACDWDNPDSEADISGRVVTDFGNLFYSGFDWTYPAFRLDIIDESNPDVVEIGEFFLGVSQQFPAGVRLSPGRADGPHFYMGRNTTHYGQDWTDYRSAAERLEPQFTNLNDPDTVDAFHTFLKSVMANGGKFIIVPDDNVPFAYYVVVENLADYANRKIYNPDAYELREWTLKLKTLTEGIRVL